MSRIASCSPVDAAAEPASTTSTPMAASLVAISNFWSGFNDTPGVCSPSRNVVSKKRSLLANMLFQFEHDLFKSMFFTIRRIHILTHPEFESDVSLRPNAYANNNYKREVGHFDKRRSTRSCHAWMFPYKDKYLSCTRS